MGGEAGKSMKNEIQCHVDFRPISYDRLSKDNWKPWIIIVDDRDGRLFWGSGWGLVTMV